MSRTLFFYGTLCHVPLLEIVLGRGADEIDIVAGHVDGFASTWVEAQPFPMIAEAEGQCAEGLCVGGLSADDLARLEYYEGGFDYALRPVQVQTGQGTIAAEMFFPEAGRWRAGVPWDLAEWAGHWGAMSEGAAREVMSGFGRVDVESVTRLLPHFRARAWARQLAAEAAPTQVRSDRDAADVAVTLNDEQTDGFFRLRSFDVQAPSFDGRPTPVLRRSAFEAFDAALILPYDPERDLVMLIEQMRYGPLLRCDPKPWVLEPIAGMVDAGEAPMEAARREALEEAGLELADIRPMMAMYAAPGYSTEYFHCFLGLTDLDESHAGLGGLAEEHEDIRSHVMDFDAAMALLDSGEINVGPLAAMLLWLARARGDLRR